jgi:hypothetical protein
VSSCENPTMPVKLDPSPSKDDAVTIPTTFKFDVEVIPVTLTPLEKLGGPSAFVFVKISALTLDIIFRSFYLFIRCQHRPVIER